MANYTILLIDYEPRSIERFRQPLTDAGYTVEVATDGLTGIEAFHRLNPDMVLVEAMIPKKHGFEVCQELKRTPHGRKTPVLITTGVYKGRKYRTQALHIYGCDEYIEKPIAPEQLLGVVGKFFGPGAVAATAAETRPSPPAQTVIAATEGIARASAPVSISHEAAVPPPVRPKPNTNSVVKDFTEEEIMARLDAILPGDALPPSTAASAPMIVSNAPDPMTSAPAPREVPDVGSRQDVHEIPEMPEIEASDPFAQMQAELTAELGSISAALAFEPAPVFESVPIPSDQAVAPSVFDALPSPETDPAPIPVAAASPGSVEADAEMPGQLVTFDAKRSRRNKKSGKKTQAHSASVPDSPAAGQPTSKMASTASPVASKPGSPLSLPHGTIAESEIGEVAVKKGIPLWIWAALAAAIAIAVYFLVVRGGVFQTEQASEPSGVSASRVAHRTPAPAEAARAPATTADTSTLVLNSVDAGALLSAATTPAPAPPKTAESSATVAPKAAAQASASGTMIPLPVSKPAPAKAPAVAKPPSVTKLAPPESAPSSGIDANADGVESIPAAPVQAAAPTIAPGTLVDASDVDTAPVSLSRKLPTYSMQARQMRLQGTVVMKVLVNERGTVDEVLLLDGVPGADVNASALRAARSWTYRPATKDGVPVKVWKTEQVAFKI